MCVRAVGAAIAAFVCVGAVHAAGADKPDRPSRLDKIERKLERANAGGTNTRLPRERTVAAPPSRALSRAESPASSAARNRIGAAGADSSFEAFRPIVERNIFDPSRIARARHTAEERRPRMDTVVLVGTLESDKGTVAFFESATPGYRRAVHAGDTLGDFTVQSIKPDHVVLVRGGQPLSVSVAGQLRRPEGGDWKVALADPTAVADTSAASPAAASAPDAPAPIPADASDVLRRLMEARQKQLNQ